MTPEDLSREHLRSLPPPAPSGTEHESWNPAAVVAFIAFFLAGALGGVISGHIALASISRNGGGGRKAVVAIIIISWVLLAISVLLVTIAIIGALR